MILSCPLIGKSSLAGPSHISLVDESNFQFAGLCLSCDTQSRACAYYDDIVFFHRFPSMVTHVNNFIVNE